MKELEIKYTDSLQVEESFYLAFRNRDIALMHNVWDKTDEVICVHPGSPRIYSYELIIASWKQIFSAQGKSNIEVIEPVYKLQDNIAIHSVKEKLYIDEKDVGIVYATNIYQQTQHGWKMIAHHASPAFSDAGSNINNHLH